MASGYYAVLISSCFAVARGLCSPRGSSEQTDHPWYEYIIHFCIGVMVLLTWAIAIFGLVVSTGRNGGHLVVGKGYREFKLGDYSPWMRKRVRNEDVWKEIKWCLIKKECHKLSLKHPDPKTGIIQFNGIQSGFCKPPDSCGFAVINASASSYQARASSSSFPSSLGGDCTLFSNGEFKCFDCDSCKAAFLDSLRRSWRTMSIIDLTMIPDFVIVQGLAICFVMIMYKLVVKLFGSCLPDSLIMGNVLD
ncbi:hypothetical protein CBR_g50901 [Chara braunii]|uniref:Tetraspanin n=1 Tax=Chara braunii TaxID=69332 RepID=A0A388M7J6_CHABU|nr:hypothetical protein CBR_g50901 [Chara braunii]|eukprot:GBG90558.1 hypothetical protein CBR_g50901 [Chara braunii]